jgi:YYY domain-containing protein
MTQFFLWYLVISIIGWITFPLIYRLMPGLPDRGYAFSRILGLLLTGYIYWILVSFGYLSNDAGGVVFAIGIITTLSITSMIGIHYQKLGNWLKKQFSLVFVVEILFLGAFAFWTLVRSYNPEIVATEKPMELAFLNAVLRTQGFPPHDPWLSGYAISYYYFGYILIGMMAQLTFTHAGIAFNLGIALIFSLSAIGAYGLVYNLVAYKGDNYNQTDYQTVVSESIQPDNTSTVKLGGEKNLVSYKLYGLPFLGPLFVLILSNLEGFLEVLHARGIFWRVTDLGEWTSTFWSWLDMKELSQPPGEPFLWIPSRYLWWWRASRVITDYDMAGTIKEVIDEFPFFSYLLADLHPHVLAMPFVLLAMALSINLFFNGMNGRCRWLWLQIEVNSKNFWLSALVLGGLAFLNTWDFPIYVILIAGVYGISRINHRSNNNDSYSNDETITHNKEFSAINRFICYVRDFFSMGFALGISGVLLYLPFYLTFSSQAGGILPNLINPTRGAHFWVMFGSLLIPIFAFQFYLWKTTGVGIRIFKGFLLAFLIIMGLWGSSLLFGWVISSIPFLGDLYLSSVGAVGQHEELFTEAIYRRLMQPGGLITMLILLGISFGIGLIYIGNTIKARRIILEEIVYSPSSFENLNKAKSHFIVVLFIFFGTLIVLLPEFFFLRDHFSTRMNTVFKFYYQVWLLWAISAAYGVSILWLNLREYTRLFTGLVLCLVLGAGLVYPPLSLWTKTNGFSTANGLTIDGTAYLARQAPDEYAAIKWLQEAHLGVLVEAIGPSYSLYGRIAAHSGQPSILNWPFHQIQWRGSGEILGTRQGDVERIYISSNWIDVNSLLQQYDVSYVYIGSMERSTYRVNEEKFKRFLIPVFQNDSVTIYRVPRELD